MLQLEWAPGVETARKEEHRLRHRDLPYHLLVVVAGRPMLPVPLDDVVGPCRPRPERYQQLEQRPHHHHHQHQHRHYRYRNHQHQHHNHHRYYY